METKIISVRDNELRTVEKKSYLFDTIFITTCQSGIIELVINLKSRADITYRGNDHTYFINRLYSDMDIIESAQTIELEQFLPPDETYLCADARNKDQAIWYYIPFHLLEPKEVEDSK